METLVAGRSEPGRARNARSTARRALDCRYGTGLHRFEGDGVARKAGEEPQYSDSLRQC
jgi:hypothetical protein